MELPTENEGLWQEYCAETNKTGAIVKQLSLPDLYKQCRGTVTDSAGA